MRRSGEWRLERGTLKGVSGRVWKSERGANPRVSRTTEILSHGHGIRLH